MTCLDHGVIRSQHPPNAILQYTYLTHNYQKLKTVHDLPKTHHKNFLDVDLINDSIISINIELNADETGK